MPSPHVYDSQISMSGCPYCEESKHIGICAQQWEASNILQEKRIADYHDKWRANGYPVPESLIGPDGYMVVSKPTMIIVDA